MGLKTGCCGSWRDSGDRGLLGAQARAFGQPLGTASSSDFPSDSHSAAAAQNEGAELAKKLSNPIADLVSVPFQLNWAQGVGPDDGTRFILNIQPVMPFSLNKNWNTITRVIVPFIGQPSLAAGGAPASGIGDVLTSFFFSPTGGKITWGIGPVISLPSNSEPTLGSGKWAAGPEGGSDLAVALGDRDPAAAPTVVSEVGQVVIRAAARSDTVTARTCGTRRLPGGMRR